MTPRVLALDTSTEALAVALQAGGRRWCRQAPGGAAASAGLLPLVRALLAEACLGAADLDAVAFGQGPGAFTGLRTACSVAQGLAWGAGLPVVPVDSLLIVAEDTRRRLGALPRLDVGVVMDARMGEVYAARYAWADGIWSTSMPPCLCAPDDLAALWPVAPAQVAGTGIGLCSAAGHVAGRDFEETADRAAALLGLALSALAAGSTVTPAEAAPVYLRDKVALTTAERQAASRPASGAAPELEGAR